MAEILRVERGLDPDGASAQDGYAQRFHEAFPPIPRGGASLAKSCGMSEIATTLTAGFRSVKPHDPAGIDFARSPPIFPGGGNASRGGALGSQDNRRKSGGIFVLRGPGGPEPAS